MPIKRKVTISRYVVSRIGRWDGFRLSQPWGFGVHGGRPSGNQAHEEGHFMRAAMPAELACQK
jgi:hypothetical protein